jgi:glycogen debranching enzyme
MRTMILAGALACCSLPVFANQCNVELNGNMQLENNVLAVTLNNNSRVTIGQDKTLYVDGTALTLDAEQQRWVDNYYDGINQAAPQAAAIATDAVALASTALNEVFTELFGSDNTALADLSEKLRNLDQQIQYNFYAENGDIRLHSESFENGGFFGEQWETQFEDAIENLVTDSIGHLMVAIGTQLIFSGGDSDAFEQKMQRFGEQMEQKVEYQAEALQGKAEELCLTLARVDDAETQLQQIPQLADLDVIQLYDQPQRM